MLIIKSDNAFTGLEAAIVLIAFVVVAAVFSYVVLGAGFFTTQKSQEVVHTSVDQTSSSLEVVGNVYGAKNGTLIDTFRFDVGLTAGGSPVDMSKTVLTYSNATKLEYLNFIDAEAIKPGEWNITAKADGGDGDNLLEPGEIFTIIAQVNDGFPVNDKARLEIKPPIGAVLGLQRTAPPQLDDWNVLK